MTTTRILAAAAIDATGLCISPAQAIVTRAPASLRAGADAVQLLSLTQAGTPAANAAAQTAGTITRTIDAPTSVLTPGFVNAHTHLDLTHVPPIAFDAHAGFLSFVRYVLGNRLEDKAAIFRSVAEGVRLSRAGGVVAVGDIAGVVGGAASSFAAEALAATGMLGVSFLEFFGFGQSESYGTHALHTAVTQSLALRAQSLDTESPWQNRLAISPHAPYTASPEAYAFAAKLSVDCSPHEPLPLCTHLAENPEERAFVSRGTGPYRELHEKLGWWCDATGKQIGHNKSPVAFLSPALTSAGTRYLLAHVNDASEADIARLAQHQPGVVYSPRSSEYFLNHEHFGPHRYQAMLRAGICVALGTDSVINLPTNTVDKTSGSLSTLDEARRLHVRDGTDALLLLKMLTINGARVLGLPERWFTLHLPTTGGALHNEHAPKAGLVLTQVESHTSDAQGRIWAQRLLTSPSRAQLIAP